MKKTFKLKVENKSPEREVEAIKKEIRKYIKREKNKKLPEGADFWDLRCKFGKNNETPKVIEFVNITKSVDSAVAADAETFYLEILSTEGKRAPRPPRERIEE